jgi:Spy/CpxP family protein refolding chaperone
MVAHQIIVIKNTRRKTMKRFAIVSLLLLAVLSAQVYGQPNEEKYLKKVVEKLNLSDQQKKDVDKIHFDMEKQTIAQRAKVATARVELQQLLKAEIPDKSAIEKKVSELTDQGVQLHLIRINSWFAVNKLLNSEQQKEWKKALENAPEMMRDKKMMRGCPMPRPMAEPSPNCPMPKCQ